MPYIVYTEEEITAALLKPRLSHAAKPVIMTPQLAQAVLMLGSEAWKALWMFHRCNRIQGANWAKNDKHPQKKDPVKAHANYLNHKHRKRQKHKDWMARDGNVEKQRVWRKLNARRIRAEDPWYKLRNRLASRLWHALQLKNAKKAYKTEALIGCTVAFCRKWIEQQFKPGMTWQNIHIDHIIPCASFDLTKPSQQKECFHYTNLQPLFERDNQSKSDKMPTTQLDLL